MEAGMRSLVNVSLWLTPILVAHFSTAWEEHYLPITLHIPGLLLWPWIFLTLWPGVDTGQPLSIEDKTSSPSALIFINLLTINIVLQQDMKRWAYFFSRGNQKPGDKRRFCIYVFIFGNHSYET